MITRLGRSLAGPAAIAFVLGLLAGGCTTTESPGPRIIDANSAVDSAISQVNVGENVVLRLPVQPDSGYTWKTVHKPSYDWIAMVLNEKRETNAAGHWQVYTLRATKPGIQAIDFAYVRTWDADFPPADTFKLNLTVAK